MNDFELRLDDFKETMKSLCPNKLPSGYRQIFLSDAALRKYLHILDERPIRTYLEIFMDWFQRSLKNASQLPKGADFMYFITKEPTVTLKVHKKGENIDDTGNSTQTQGKTRDKREILVEEVLSLISEKLSEQEKNVFQDRDCINYYIDEVLTKKQIETPYNKLFADWLAKANEKGYYINAKSFKMFMEFLKKPRVQAQKPKQSTTRAIMDTQEEDKRKSETSDFHAMFTEIELLKPKKYKGFGDLMISIALAKSPLPKDEEEIFKKYATPYVWNDYINKTTGVINAPLKRPPPPKHPEDKATSLNDTIALVHYSRYMNSIKSEISLKLLPVDTKTLSLEEWFNTVYPDE